MKISAITVLFNEALTVEVLLQLVSLIIGPFFRKRALRVKFMTIQ